MIIKNFYEKLSIGVNENIPLIESGNKIGEANLVSKVLMVNVHCRMNSHIYETLLSYLPKVSDHKWCSIVVMLNKNVETFMTNAKASELSSKVIRYQDYNFSSINGEVIVCSFSNIKEAVNTLVVPGKVGIVYCMNCNIEELTNTVINNDPLMSGAFISVGISAFNSNDIIKSEPIRYSNARRASDFATYNKSNITSSTDANTTKVNNAPINSEVKKVSIDEGSATTTPIVPTEDKTQQIKQVIKKSTKTSKKFSNSKSDASIGISLKEILDESITSQLASNA